MVLGAAQCEVLSLEFSPVIGLVSGYIFFAQNVTARNFLENVFGLLLLCNTLLFSICIGGNFNIMSDVSASDSVLFALSPHEPFFYEGGLGCEFTCSCHSEARF